MKAHRANTASEYCPHDHIAERLPLRPTGQRVLLALLFVLVAAGASPVCADEADDMDVLGIRSGQSADDAQAAIAAAHPEMLLTGQTIWSKSNTNTGGAKLASRTYCLKLKGQEASALGPVNVDGLGGNRDCSDRVTVHFSESATQVVGVFRWLAMSESSRVESLKERLITKYGPPLSDGSNSRGFIYWQRLPAERGVGAALFEALSRASHDDTCMRSIVELPLYADLLPRGATKRCGTLLRVGISESSPGVVSFMTTIMLDMTAIFLDYQWKNTRDRTLEQERIERLKREATGAPRL